MRIQLALNVSDLDRAIDYYSRLFATPVNKRKPGYANFAIEDPPLKLVLFERPEAGERLDHLGVEAFEDAQVEEATRRLEAAGLTERVERRTTCCYAVADKVWSREPDGLPWEVYRVLADADEPGGGEAPARPPLEEPCRGD